MGNEQYEGFIRISTILDYFTERQLVEWMIKHGKDSKRMSKQATKVGTEVDQAIKQFVAFGTYGKVKTVEANSCLEGFKRWYEDYNPVLTIGKRLFSDDLKLTGEPDLYWNSRILDIKCASAIRPKYHLQTAAYAMMDGKDATGILRLHKQLEDYEYIERNDVEVDDDKETFLYMLRVFRYFNKPLMAAGDKNADNPSDNSL